MNRISIILVAVFTLFICNQANATTGDPSQHVQSDLDYLTAFQIVWMHDQERLAMDLNQAFYEDWGEPLFASVAASKRRCMDKLKSFIDLFEIGMYGAISDEPLVYSDERHADAFSALIDRGKGSLQQAFSAAAYVEEWNISEYRADIRAIELGQCSPCEGLQLLRDTYSELLAVSYVTFVKLVSHVDDYSAQLLSQSDVDAIVAETTQPVDEKFVINPGLTDAWYNPATSGQGFFIAIHEKQARVFMSWLTFDTDLPEAGVTAHLGDAGQRWLTAQGYYEGALAELVVHSSGGGLFNVSLPVPVSEVIGTILLQFEDCNSGSLSYNLPNIEDSGSIPIQRLAPDNTEICAAMAQLSP